MKYFNPLCVFLFILIGGTYGAVVVRDYVFNVTQIADHPHVMLPSDMVPDSSYKPIDSSKYYAIRFSSQLDTVFIDSGIYGVKSKTNGDRIQYDINIFAGGRFVIWQDSVPIKAELTRYGSGVPIIDSERGFLTPVDVYVKNIPHSSCQTLRPNFSIERIFLVNGKTSKGISKSTKIMKKINRGYLCF